MLVFGRPLGVKNAFSASNFPGPTLGLGASVEACLSQEAPADEPGT